MNEKEINTLIFDLGGVIIDLHIDRTIAEFGRLSNRPGDEIEHSYGKPEFFNEFEKGLINPAEYRANLREYLKSTASDNDLDTAWNAMLGKINPLRIEKLQELKKSHQLILLSNTNAIHVPVFTGILKNTSGISSLSALFDKVYFSHEINLRKPDEEIFQFVIDENSLHPAETLFLDDTLENLKGAQNLGINTMRVTHPDEWIEFFYGGAEDRKD